MMTTGRILDLLPVLDRANSIPFLLDDVDVPDSHIIDADDFTFERHLLRLAPDGSKLKVLCEMRLTAEGNPRYYALTKEPVTLGAVVVPIDSPLMLTRAEEDWLGACDQRADYLREDRDDAYDRKITNGEWDASR